MNETPAKQWIAVGPDEKAFFLGGRSRSKLPPGIYTAGWSQGVGYVFSAVSARPDEFLRFPRTEVDEVLVEIEHFWTQSMRFYSHGLPFKRGVLLYGPPGVGKSAAVTLVANGIVERGGIVLRFSTVSSFVGAYRVFRGHEPKTPLVVTLEDIDSILENDDETGLLNVLDGMEYLDRVLFLATTNNPELLARRVKDRPSRFDRLIKVNYPDESMRSAYLNSLIRPGDEVDVARWVSDTNGMSLAHVKELFISVAILGAGYDQTLNGLKEMRRNLASSAQNFGDTFGETRYGRYS